MDDFVSPDPQNTFVRPASGVYKSIVALPGKEADYMMFRDVPHGNLIEHHYLNQVNKVARRVVVYTPPDYNTSNTADPAKTNKTYKMIFIGSGTEDTAVNGGRTMHDALTKAGVRHIWSEDPGYGHDYQIWRQYFHRLMQQTFHD